MPRISNLTELPDIEAQLYNPNLQLYSVSKTLDERTNIGIQRYNEDMDKVETRINELQQAIKEIKKASESGTSSQDIAHFVESSCQHLFDPLPNLKVAPLTIKPKENESLLTDKRSGKQYLIHTDIGLMKFLKDNVSKDTTYNFDLPTDSETVEVIERNIITSCGQERSAESLALHRAFQLGAWLQLSRATYKKQFMPQISGVPVYQYIRDHVDLSKSYVNKLIVFYDSLREYKNFLACSVSLSFMMQHLRTIVRILQHNKNMRDFWRG